MERDDLKEELIISRLRKVSEGVCSHSFPDTFVQCRPVARVTTEYNCSLIGLRTQYHTVVHVKSPPKPASSISGI